jgi:hypothetical protein
LEAHVGVGVAGTSSVEHEADLMLLPRATAEACRDQAVSPQPSQVILLVEAKCISADAVPLGYGSGLLGLDKDLGASMIGALITTRPNPSVDRLLGQWGLSHLSNVLSAPGVVDVAEVEQFFDTFLKLWARSGSDWKRAKRRGG